MISKMLLKMIYPMMLATLLIALLMGANKGRILSENEANVNRGKEALKGGSP